ncbi:MAG: YraN family protein [Oscillatoria sp. SIO1A7]|nr:YraN family protein [Oscillatoria sp. SIO1A7]
MSYSPSNLFLATGNSRQRKLDLGLLGENCVCKFLAAANWKILHQRWRCTRGEIDIIAWRNETPDSPEQQANLRFVEVKTRSSGSWDAGGLLAITPEKQAKLLQAAQMFLASRPDLADLPCQFDVALVSCRRSRQKKQASVEAIGLGKPVLMGEYQLTLDQYIEGAFSF